MIIMMTKGFIKAHLLCSIVLSLNADFIKDIYFNESVGYHFFFVYLGRVWKM